MKKVTMQDIANAIGISRISVWKAFHDYPGISPRLKKEIFEKAEEMGYRKVNSQSVTTQPEDSAKTVAVIVSRPDSSKFWLDIIHQIAKELTKENVNLMYTYVPSFYKENYQLPAILTAKQVSGAIVLNVNDPALTRLINKLDIPLVFLDIPPAVKPTELNGDLILIEGRCATKELTKHILAKGKTRIGFIGDINYAQTNFERYHGYLDAMADYSLKVEPAICFTEPINIYRYEEEIHRFLKGLKLMPEAFVCVSDFVAQYVETFLSANGYHIPDDVAMTGFDGRREYANVADILTTALVQTDHLGKRLANQLLFRMNHPQASYCITYVLSELQFNASTGDQGG
ncbi:LacI family transcriptional regulator [Clostridiales bacterium COT073_COT-073]|nr:LacI family transcriptional regulator [Clostridiales bacterium COT073_COT-073]